jgi:hypothetical protein
MIAARRGGRNEDLLGALADNVSSDDDRKGSRNVVARGTRNTDMMGALMGETDPTLGQAFMAHPFQSLLIGTAIFGVGALVGKERIIDAGLAVGDAVSGATHRSIRGARERRAIAR